MAARCLVLGPAAAPRGRAGGRLPSHLHAHRDRGSRRPDRRWQRTWIDPLIGSRIRLGLSDRFGIAAEGSFGGFGVGSDFTWNLQAFVGYRTTLFGRETTFALGYRALHQDYDHNDFEWDVTMHGPVIGSSVRF
jgi:hypothetical protein